MRRIAFLKRFNDSAISDDAHSSAITSDILNGKAEVLLNNPNVTIHHIDIGLASSNQYARTYSAMHHLATHEQLNKALADANWLVRDGAARNPNITHDQLDVLLTDPNDSVRRSAVKNPNATEKHKEIARNDPSVWVRNAANNIR